MPTDWSRLQDSLSTDELQQLLKALGFPKGLFKKNLPRGLWEKSHVNVKELIEFCDLRYFHRDLHYTVNLKPAAYNANTLKKSFHLVGTKMLTFTDLENIRLAYETYEDYDQRGMTTNVWTIMKALKLCGRVAAPLKIINKLRHLQPTHKVDGRIQFYEFLDLLALCQMHSRQGRDHDDDIDKAPPTAKNHRDLYQVDEFQYLVIPKEKKLWAMLNEQYRQEELRFDKPELVSEIFKEKPLNPDDFQLQVRLAQKEYEVTRKRLKESERQIKLSRGGLTKSKPRKKPLRSSPTSHKKINKPTEGPPAWAQRSVQSARHSTTTAAPPSHHSAPVQSVTKKESLKSRPQSCPPVVSSTSREEMNTKLNDVRFDISTQKERYNIRINKQLSTYLPDNYEEVIARLRKQSRTPNQKKYARRKLAGSIPTANDLKRLSQPGPLLPNRHVTHCDATSFGLCGDNHAMALQRHGLQFVRKKPPPKTSVPKSKPRKKEKKPERISIAEELNRMAWRAYGKKGLRRNASLLERLLVDNDTDPPAPDVATAKETIKARVSTGDAKPVVVEKSPSVPDVVKEGKEEPPPERPPVVTKKHRIQPPRPLHGVEEVRPLPEAESSASRLDQALYLLKGDCTKIFLDPDSFDTPRKEPETDDEMDDDDDPYRGQDYERYCPSSSSSRTSLELTEFEKFVHDDDNLTVAMDDLSLTTLHEESNADLRRMRKSFKRIYRRLSSISSKHDVTERRHVDVVSPATKSTR